MAGYRPSFYNEDAKLQSIEILAWAVTLPAFTISEAKSHFGKQLEEYKDADHEMSERLRKLLKSGMIVVAEVGVLNAQEAILRSKEKGGSAPVGELAGDITLEKLLVVKQMLGEIDKLKRGRGRPPRLYFTTQAAAKYVESRAKDLAAIAKTRAKEKK